MEVHTGRVLRKEFIGKEDTLIERGLVSEKSLSRDAEYQLFYDNYARTNKKSNNIMDSKLDESIDNYNGKNKARVNQESRPALSSYIDNTSMYGSEIFDGDGDGDELGLSLKDDPLFDNNAIIRRIMTNQTKNQKYIDGGGGHTDESRSYDISKIKERHIPSKIEKNVKRAEKKETPKSEPVAESANGDKEKAATVTGASKRRVVPKRIFEKEYRESFRPKVIPEEVQRRRLKTKSRSTSLVVAPGQNDGGKEVEMGKLDTLSAMEAMNEQIDKQMALINGRNIQKKDNGESTTNSKNGNGSKQNGGEQKTGREVYAVPDDSVAVVQDEEKIKALVSNAKRIINMMRSKKTPFSDEAESMGEESKERKEIQLNRFAVTDSEEQDDVDNGSEPDISVDESRNDTDDRYGGESNPTTDDMTGVSQIHAFDSFPSLNRYGSINSVNDVQIYGRDNSVGIGLSNYGLKAIQVGRSNSSSVADRAGSDKNKNRKNRTFAARGGKGDYFRSSTFNIGNGDTEDGQATRKNNRYNGGVKQSGSERLLEKLGNFSVEDIHSGKGEVGANQSDSSSDFVKRDRAGSENKHHRHNKHEIYEGEKLKPTANKLKGGLNQKGNSSVDFYRESTNSPNIKQMALLNNGGKGVNTLPNDSQLDFYDPFSVNSIDRHDLHDEKLSVFDDHKSTNMLGGLIADPKSGRLGSEYAPNQRGLRANIAAKKDNQADNSGGKQKQGFRRLQVIESYSMVSEQGGENHQDYDEDGAESESGDYTDGSEYETEDESQNEAEGSDVLSTSQLARITSPSARPRLQTLASHVSTQSHSSYSVERVGSPINRSLVPPRIESANALINGLSPNTSRKVLFSSSSNISSEVLGLSFTSSIDKLSPFSNSMLPLDNNVNASGASSSISIENNIYRKAQRRHVGIQVNTKKQGPDEITARTAEKANKQLYTMLVTLHHQFGELKTKYFTDVTRLKNLLDESNNSNKILIEKTKTLEDQLYVASRLVNDNNVDTNKESNKGPEKESSSGSASNADKDNGVASDENGRVGNSDNSTDNDDYLDLDARLALIYEKITGSLTQAKERMVDATTFKVDLEATDTTELENLHGTTQTTSLDDNSKNNNDNNDNNDNNTNNDTNTNNQSLYNSNTDLLDSRLFNHTSKPPIPNKALLKSRPKRPSNFGTNSNQTHNGSSLAGKLPTNPSSGAADSKSISDQVSIC